MGHQNFKFHELKLSKTFSNLIPKLPESAFNELKADILERGILDPLLIWNGYLIDGHHRYEIAKSQDPPLPFEVREIKGLKDEHDVIKWMIRNQINRRNVNCFAKAELALKYVEELKQHDPEGELLNKDELFKKRFGISKETVYRVSYILKFGTPEMIESARNEELNVLTSYKKVNFYRQRKQRRPIKLKDIEILGHYVNKDCLDYIQELKRHSINLIITEPPQPNDPEIIKKFNKNLNLRKGYVLVLFEKMLTELDKIIKPSSDFFIIVDPKFMIDFYNVLKKMYNIKHFLVWDYRKSKETLNPKLIQSRYKSIIWAYKGAERPLTSSTPDVIEEKFDQNYPLDSITESLVKKLISLVETDGTCVFDPFAGYGSVVRASLDARVPVYSCELNSDKFDQGYVMLAKRRVEV